MGFEAFVGYTGMWKGIEDRIHLATTVMSYTVACESIHPPWHFYYFVALQPGIKIDFWGVCIILFTQHAYHFEDAKYVLLWNKQEITTSLLGYTSISLAHLATGIFAHSSRENCSSSFKLDGFRWCTAIYKSYHRFSIGSRSGLWLGHSNTFKCFPLNHLSVA